MCGTYGGSGANQTSGRAVRSGVWRGVGLSGGLGTGLAATSEGVWAGGVGLGTGAVHSPVAKAAATTTRRSRRCTGNLTELLRRPDDEPEQRRVAAGVGPGGDDEIQGGAGGEGERQVERVG